MFSLSPFSLDESELMKFFNLLQNLITIATLALIACWAAPSRLNAEDRVIAKSPNIILVFIDDMGWGDFSCFGNQAVETQNIDRLAKEGIRFEQFYVNSPICSPSRVAISTGQYPARWKITSYLADRQLNQRRGMAQWLNPEAPMLARFLQNSGYSTGHFGKWHMGGQRDVGEAPLISRYGFDQSLTNFEGLGPRVLALKDAYNGKKATAHTLGSDKLGDPSEITFVDRSLVTQSFTQSALEFIKKSESEKKPFYINLWPDDVHSPFFPPAARRSDGTKRALYHGVLDTMDEQLGVLFNYVRNSKRLQNNTLILVCSDNGPEQGAGSAGPFRGFKTHLFEGGIRSSLIAWAPGLINSDKVGTVNTDSWFSAMDLVPSILSIANIETDTRFDGQPLDSMILGNSQRSRTAPLFFRRPPDRDSFYGISDCPDLAVRDGDWKLLCEYDGTQPELYNLKTDRGESNNVASEHPNITRRLTESVIQWHQIMPPDAGATFASTPRKRKPKNP